MTSNLKVLICYTVRVLGDGTTCSLNIISVHAGRVFLVFKLPLHKSDSNELQSNPGYLEVSWLLLDYTTTTIADKQHHNNDSGYQLFKSGLVFPMKPKACSYEKGLCWPPDDQTDKWRGLETPT